MNPNINPLYQLHPFIADVADLCSLGIEREGFRDFHASRNPSAIFFEVVLDFLLFVWR